MANPAAKDLAQVIGELVSKAKKALQSAQEYQKRYFDRKHHDLQFSVGDKVLLSSKNLPLQHSPKLKPRFVGPFEVVACVGPSSYRLNLQGRYATVHPVFHVSYLSPWSAGGSAAEPPLPIVQAGQQEWEVEAVLRHRRRGRNV